MLRIGYGIEQQHNYKCIKFTNDIIIPYEDKITSLKILIHHVFPNIETYFDNLHAMANRVILTPIYECAKHVNKIFLEQIPDKIYIYYSFDEVIDKS